VVDEAMSYVSSDTIGTTEEGMGRGVCDAG